MTIRLASSILLPLLTAALVTACSDDGNGNSGTIDAAPIDADPPGDCGCTGTPADATPIEPGWNPEGGEFRLERFQVGPEDTDAELAAQALFFTNQSPPARSFAGKNIPLRPELANQGYTCHDYSDGNNFDNGKSLAAQAVVDSRDYFDVGATAKLTNAEDATDVITLNKFLGDENAAAATDRSAGLVHDILYKAPETTIVKRNATYLPDIASSDEYPELDLAFGETAPGEALSDPETGEGTPQIFVPSAFTMTSPAEADFYTAGALVFTTGQDLELTYTPAEPTPAGWPSIMRFIAFVNDAGMVEAYCLKFAIGEPEDFEFTVPHEVLGYVQADAGGQAVFGRMVHAAWETQPEKARMDLIGIESKVSPGFVIQDAPAASK